MEDIRPIKVVDRDEIEVRIELDHFTESSQEEEKRDPPHKRPISNLSDNENKLSPERKAYKNQNTLSTKGMKTKNAMSPSGRQNTRKFSEDLNNSPLPSYKNVTPKSKLQVPSTNAKSGGGFLSRLKTIGKSKKTDDEYRIDDYLEWK